MMMTYKEAAEIVESRQALVSYANEMSRSDWASDREASRLQWQLLNAPSIKTKYLEACVTLGAVIGENEIPDWKRPQHP